jgi:hypothetical protein
MVPAPTGGAGGSGAGGTGAAGAGWPAPVNPADLDPNLGLTWDRVPTGTDASLFDVVWTGSRLYAVGDAGMVLSSADGTSWTRVSSGSGQAFIALLWTGARLVAIDANQQIFTSDNGASWTPRFNRADMPVKVLGKVGATLVALGATEDDYFAVSSNGIDWTVRKDPQLTSVFFSGCASSPSQLICVGWRNLINVSQGAAFSTTDGVTWEEVSPDFAVPPLRGAGWKGDELMAAGELGAVLLRTSGGGWLYRHSWASRDEGDTTKPAHALLWTGKRAVAAGKEILITSDSAHPSNWRRQYVAAAGWAIAFTGKRLVVVGENGGAFFSPSDTPPPADAAVPMDVPPDVAPDGICTAAQGDPCAHVGETCVRTNAFQACCICEVNESCGPGPRWYCARREVVGSCAGQRPVLGQPCGPATIACQVCDQGVPRRLFCERSLVWGPADLLCK